MQVTPKVTNSHATEDKSIKAEMQMCSAHSQAGFRSPLLFAQLSVLPFCSDLLTPHTQLEHALDCRLPLPGCPSQCLPEVSSRGAGTFSEIE
eukprot:1147007-Pelagomonas_calceolata.AAC.1